MGSVKKTAAAVATAGAVVGVALYLALQPVPSHTHTLRWTSDDPWTVNFEVWHSTNLRTWSLLATVPRTGNVAQLDFTPDKPAEFFRVRSLNALGQWNAGADW